MLNTVFKVVKNYFKIIKIHIDYKEANFRVQLPVTRQMQLEGKEIKHKNIKFATASGEWKRLLYVTKKKTLILRKISKLLWEMLSIINLAHHVYLSGIFLLILLVRNVCLRSKWPTKTEVRIRYRRKKKDHLSATVCTPGSCAVLRPWVHSEKMNVKDYRLQEKMFYESGCLYTNSFVILTHLWQRSMVYPSTTKRS